jgi:glycosyltransferase involved in cell wall biosynthesis
LRISVVIASRNEGSNLLKTVRSVKESGSELDLEVVVQHDESLGVSPSRADGVEVATGDVLVFFDAHVKPENDCLARLMLGIERTDGNAVVVPMVMQFDTDTWLSDASLRGFGYELTLDRCGGRWLELGEMRQRRLGDEAYWESPTVVGCSVAVHRGAYHDIMGFDSLMRTWGMEDVDFGIRAWMTGHAVLCDPVARVGHRFVTEFMSYTARYVDLGANQIRMARKLFGDDAFAEWLDMRGLGTRPIAEEHPVYELWREAWAQYREDAHLVEAAASEFKERRIMDEYEYADRFELSWPARRC